MRAMCSVSLCVCVSSLMIWSSRLRPEIQGMPGYRGCQDTRAARIHGLSGYIGCQDTGDARSGCQDTGTIKTCAVQCSGERGCQDRGPARIQGLPGYRGCQDTGIARIQGLQRYRGCQDTGAASRLGLPGYRGLPAGYTDSQDTWAARIQVLFNAQKRGAARIQWLPGYRCCQDTGAARTQGLQGYTLHRFDFDSLALLPPIDLYIVDRL